MIYLYYKSLVPFARLSEQLGDLDSAHLGRLGLLVLLWLKTKNPRLLTDAAEIIGGCGCRSSAVCLKQKCPARSGEILPLPALKGG